MALQRAMWMRLTPAERFLHAALMFDSARAMVISSLPPDMTWFEFRRQLYERIYGQPLPEGFPREPNTAGSLPAKSANGASR
jgi:hypothetical protein